MRTISASEITNNCKVLKKYSTDINDELIKETIISKYLIESDRYNTITKKNSRIINYKTYYRIINMFEKLLMFILILKLYIVYIYL